MDRISHDEQMLLHAQVAALRSTCTRLHVGAVLVKDENILSTGRNGTARGLPHCSCGPEAPCTATVHAEANAVAFAARRGGGTEGATLYATHAPCVRCAGLLINAGIVRVVFLDYYRDEEGLAMLMAARVLVEKLGGTLAPLARPL